jgi:hypothetical protein
MRFRGRRPRRPRAWAAGRRQNKAVSKGNQPGGRSRLEKPEQGTKRQVRPDPVCIPGSYCDGWISSLRAGAGNHPGRPAHPGQRSFPLSARVRRRKLWGQLELVAPKHVRPLDRRPIRPLPVLDPPQPDEPAASEGSPGPLSSLWLVEARASFRRGRGLPATPGGDFIVREKPTRCLEEEAVDGRRPTRRSPARP